MSLKPRGLTAVPTEDLRDLLRHLHHQQIPCPLRADTLACIGLQHRQEALLETFRGLDDRSTRALLTAVLAERAG